MPHVRSRDPSPLPALLGAMLVCAAAAPLSAATSGPDTEPPLIELETLPQSRAERNQVFTAQVVDDRALDDVVLYHRRQGQQPFARAPMRSIGDSGYFSVTITTDPEDLRAIEYYVQARDRSGNRSVSGFAFDPFRRTLLPMRRSPVADARTGIGAPAPEETPSTRPRWWAIALGVVAVGALALAAGGSDDGGDGGNGARLTIDLQEPRSR